MNTKILFTLYFICISSLLFAQKKDKDKAAILLVMDFQEKSWNVGNLEKFMEGYWRSDSLKFIGKNGIQYGWQKTLDNYKKSYPDLDAMGKLTFTILTLEKLSSSSAFMIGRWHLKRKNDELSGHFTLLWRKIDGKWLIVIDHSS